MALRGSTKVAISLVPLAAWVVFLGWLVANGPVASSDSGECWTSVASTEEGSTPMEVTTCK
ncbi:hypothetical protein [Microbacterium sp. NPDC055683]